MRLRKLTPEELVDAYGTRCRSLFPWPGVAETPFGASWGILAPGTTSVAHAHHEGEAFVVAQGRGTVTVDGTHAELEAGDAVYVPPLSAHHFANVSATEPMVLVKVWWEDPALLPPPRPARGAARGPVLVTATPPTPNGDLHVGHLSGPYLRADIHVRYLRLRGVEAYYLTGIDDNQSYVALKGERIGASAEETAERFGRAMTATLQAARVEADVIGRPRASAYHVPLVRDFFQRLWEKGELVVKDAPALFCGGCDEFVFEAYVSGGCPHCGTPSGGNACEVCGRPNDCADLREPKCNRCGGTPSLRSYPRLYFPLSRHEEALRRFWSSVRMGPHLASLCERMLADGLPDVAVSHAAEWGIPVPVTGYETQRIYVWFEMAPGYLAATRELADRLGSGAGWEGFWKEEGPEVVQFFGFDNGYFHAVLFPALFHAYDPEIRLPRAFVTNEFYRLDGLKFSTSRVHAIWGPELLAQVPADVARFYVAYSGPETEQTNFTYAALVETVARELEGGWQPWLAELGARVERDFGGAAPAPGLWTEGHRRFHEELRALAAEAARAYEAESFSTQRAVRVVCELARAARAFAAAEEHWRGLPGRAAERRTGVALELAAARALALLAAPVMPDFAARLWAELGHEGAFPARGGWEETPGFVPAGQRVALTGGWFAPLPASLELVRP